MEFLQEREDGMTAENWKTMYLILFRGICEAVDKDRTKKRREMTDILVKASLDAEEYYMSVSDAAAGPVQKA